jgi:tRNA(Ile)-lysidine synthase
MSLTDRFLENLQHSRLIPAGSRVLVAVSGGADSVALLELLRRVAPRLELSLTVAHFDHALRHDSAADARFVERHCHAAGLPLVSARRDVAALAEQRGGNLEEVARDERRAFLLDAAEREGCALVALGHHADDQAETFLLRLLRGSGPTGLAGMRLRNGMVVRPLLALRRAELEAFLRDEGIAWREDASNRDPRFTRNRIRHQLLPQLLEYNPQVAAQLAALSSRFARDEEFWAELVGQALSDCRVADDGGLELDSVKLSGLAPALRTRVVRAALELVRGSLRGVTAAHVDAIEGLLDGPSPQAELDLPGAWIARRYERLLIAGSRPAPVGPIVMLLPGPGRYPLPRGELCLTLEPAAQGESATAVEFEAATVPFPLQLRSRQPGDRMRPSGMTGSRKLQDLFVDLKLTREQRDAALLLLCGDELLWVVGLRRAEGHRAVAEGGVLRVVFSDACGS